MKKILYLLLAGTIVFSTSVMVSCDKKDSSSTYNQEKIENLNLPKSQKDTLNLDIYFDSSTDKNADSAKETRKIVKEELVGETIINELIKGPSIESKLKPILPKNTKLLSFSIKAGVAYVNFSDEVHTALTAEKEKITLDCIVSSLTQLKSIKKVQILIENKSDDSIGGNYDLSKPLEKGELYEKRK